MHIIHNHPCREAELEIDSRHVIIDENDFNKAKLMEKAMLNFIKRVENGEVRSVKTYSEFKYILGIEKE